MAARAVADGHLNHAGTFPQEQGADEAVGSTEHRQAKRKRASKNS